jgi:hypothetical protein
MNKEQRTKLPNGIDSCEYSDLLIGIVGPCNSGKTTLVNGLKRNGFIARHIAQEHSYAPNMWRRITNPDILIYLDVTYQISQERRTLDWTSSQFDDQNRRLVNAHEHANLIINTDPLAIPEVLDLAISFLQGRIRRV